MLYKFKENDLYGFIDETGSIIIPPKYRFTEYFSNGRCLVYKEVKANSLEQENGEKTTYAYLDEQGKEVIQQASHGKSFYDGYAMVYFKDKGKWGFIDKNGKTLINPQFSQEYSSGFSEGLVDVSKGEHWGYVDSTAKVIIPFDYDWTYPFSEGFAVVKRKGKKFYIDKQAAKLKTVKCTIVEPTVGGFREGLAVVKFGKSYGFINTEGLQALDQLFEFADGFYEGLCAVKLDGKFGYIDSKGKMIIEPKLEGAGSFHLGVATFKKADKWGLIDKTGQVIKEPIYDFIHGFGLYGWGVSEKDERRLAMAELDKREVYINLQGEIVADREVNPKSKFDHELLKNWKPKEIWDKAIWYYEGGGTTIKGATQHIYFVLKWLKGKGLLSEEGKAVYAEKNNLDICLAREMLKKEGADFLDRYYQLWYENENIINFQIDPSLKFKNDESLDEYWADFLAKQP